MVAHLGGHQPQQVARDAGEQRHIRGEVQAFHQEIEGGFGAGQPELRGGALVHLAIVIARQGTHVKLAAEPAQESLVAQLAWLEIGGEHRPYVERHREAHAGAQREHVDVAVQRHDPAVQQVGHADQLPAQVIDDVDAVVGLHVRRRLVEARGVVVAQVQGR
ncbi:hypothetical protein D9M70_335810 [compost metagenome]